MTWLTKMVLCAGIFVPLPALPECRQALAMGLDVSGSVDTREYRLQIDGVIAALGSRPVRNALLSVPNATVDLLVYEWSGENDHTLLLNWTTIASVADIALVQDHLARVTRRDAAPGTAIGKALEVGFDLLEQRKHCRKRVLDVSGDGKSNIGPRPEEIRDRMNAAGITINALVIGADGADLNSTQETEIGELSSYFRSKVITGPDAFVQTALGYETYADAMTRKLERELQGVTLSWLDGTALPRQVDQ